jgi:hypothetical protein
MLENCCIGRFSLCLVKLLIVSGDNLYSGMWFTCSCSPCFHIDTGVCGAVDPCLYDVDPGVRGVFYVFLGVDTRCRSGVRD